MTDPVWLNSRSEPGKRYEMVRMPESWIHNGEGCESENWRGPLECSHVKTLNQEDGMSEVVVYEPPAGSLTLQDFRDPEVRRVMRETVAKDISEPEFDLFAHVCVGLGLNPYAGEIFAVARNVNVAPRNQPKVYEKRLSIQIGVEGYRKMADASGEFAGVEGPWFAGEDGEWKEIWPTSAGEPVYCKVIAHRRNCVPATTIRKLKAVKQDSDFWKGDKLTEQFAKATEVLALRRLFPHATARVDRAMREAKQEMPTIDSATMPAETGVGFTPEGVTILDSYSVDGDGVIHEGEPEDSIEAVYTDAADPPPDSIEAVRQYVEDFLKLVNDNDPKNFREKVLPGVLVVAPELKPEKGTKLNYGALTLEHGHTLIAHFKAAGL